jgi:tRNA A37 threonylcarbamoyladenosine modification protein TsaB
VRVDRGPGSYVGLRVAVTLARCICAFAPAELLTVDSLAMAAVAALQADPALRHRRLCPVLDGRQGRLQISALALGASGSLAAANATLLADADLADFLCRGDVVLAGAGLSERIAGGVGRAGAELRAMPAVRADVLFARELTTATTSPEALQPIYLTGSYVC